MEQKRSLNFMTVYNEQKNSCKLGKHEKCIRHYVQQLKLSIFFLESHYPYSTFKNMLVACSTTNKNN